MIHGNGNTQPGQGRCEGEIILVKNLQMKRDCRAAKGTLTLQTTRCDPVKLTIKLIPMGACARTCSLEG